MTAFDPRAMPPFRRPVRIPQRVPVERADPCAAVAGEELRLRLPFRLSADVREDACLKVRLDGGRNSRCVMRPLQCDDPGKPGFVTARRAGGAALGVRPGEAAGTFVIQPPEGGLGRGDVVEVILGDGPGGGTRAPGARQLDGFFVLYAPTDPDHKATCWNDETQPWIVGACSMHVLGGALDHLRAHAPSQAAPSRPIAILVRPEDLRSNLSHVPLRDLTALIGDDEVPARVEPLADSTCARVVLSLPGEGVFRVLVRDRASGAEAATNPIVCRASAGEPNAWWGMIHGHSEMSDGTGSLDYYFVQMRDESALDFAAPGDHDHLWETSDEMWRVTSETVKRCHEPGRFVTFLGYEWAKWRRNGDGDRNVYYLDDDRPMYRSDDGRCPTPPDLFRALRSETAIVIPHHTGHNGNFCDWKDHDAEHERLVEIHQVRGSYECSEQEGNALPEREGQPYTDGYVRRALALGWRVGFTAGGDDHVGHAGTDWPTDYGQSGYYAGLMCVLAEQNTRRALWEAMWNRRVIATSGPRMLLTWRLNGRLLGSELDLRSMPELAHARELSVEFHGTAPLDRIDVIRNNEVVHTARPAGLDARVAWTDEAPLAEVLLPAACFCDHPFCFYYVRAVQQDRQTAWASPVWIDAPAAP